MDSYKRKVAFFCDPYPGELFYSAIARFFRYTPFLDLDQKHELLFGRKSSVQLLLVRGMDELQKALGSDYTLEAILQNHTVWPYFSPFLSRSRQNKLLANVRVFGPPFESSLNLKTHSNVLSRPRYCPDCVVQDVAAYGEAYFHTFHHLPGIDICPRHHRYLLDYPGGYKLFRYDYLDETVIENSSELCEDPHEIRLAHLAASSLETDYQDVCAEHTIGRLRQFFEKEGCFKNNLISYKDLYERLQEFYPLDFLKKHDLLVRDLSRKNCWFKKCFTSERLDKFFNYLVLIAMFSDSLPDFLFSEDDPATHVCENPFCPHYGTSEATREKTSEEKKTIVECECGMIYSVTVLDPQAHILQYGNLWLENVKRLKNEGMSSQALARKLGVSPYFINQALKKEKMDPISERVYDCREQLLDLLAADPQCNRTQLLEKMGAPFRYLRKYDWQWLDSVVPQQRSGNASPQNNWNIDYEERDRQYVQKIMKVIENRNGGSLQSTITRREICMEAFGTKSLSQLDRLPKTKKLLDNLTKESCVNTQYDGF